MEINYDRLSIFIDSYDKNCDVWDTFFTVFNYFWNNCPYKRFLVTNEKEFSGANLVVLKTGKDIDWFSTTLSALHKLDSKYIWLFLDDYFLSKKISITDIEEILDYMELNNIFFYRLSLRGDLDRNVIRHKIRKDFFYAINLQPAIWERKKFVCFLETLKAQGLKTPWEFENYFIEYFRNSKSNEVIDGIIYDTRDLMGYQNAIIQGKWVRRVVYFYKKEFGITINVKNRKVMPLTAEIFDSIKRNGHAIFSYNTRKTIKIFLSKIGFKFMTK